MKTLALYNLKGGVGKTAAAVNLAYLAARGGLRTLLWDLDPQAAATYYFRVRPGVKGGEKLIRKRKRALKSIKVTDYERLELLPGDFALRHLDAGLREHERPTARLGALLATLAGDYDYVFLDCPPSISMLSENVFECADALLIPLIPTELSLRAYDQVTGFLASRERARAVARPFFSMVDRRRRLHRETVTDFVRTHPEVLRTYIPYASEVERMGVHRAPVPCYAASSMPARAFEALWEGVRGSA